MRGIPTGLRRCVWTALILGWGTTAFAKTGAPQKVDGKIRWVYGYAEGQKLARDSSKPLFVVFRCER